MTAPLDPCRGGPAACMDDICRSSEVGWCGRHRADYVDEPDDEEWDEGIDWENSIFDRNDPAVRRFIEEDE